MGRSRYHRRVRRVAICCLLAACGRLHFDERVDAPDVPARCAPSAVAADPLTITGTTFRYMSFDNEARTILGGATVTAFDVQRGKGTTTTSDASGRYTVTIATDGTPTALRLEYALPSHFTTQVTIDRAVDRDIAGATDAVWTLGDGPLWNAGTMDQFYAVAGTARQAANGTLNIAVRDCAGAPLGGVTIDVSPAPELLRNQANDGTLAAGGTTSDRFATVFGLNAAAGTTTITASADGYTFRPLTVAVTADLYNTLAILHADP